MQLKGQMDQRELAMNRKEIEAYQKRKRGVMNSIIPGINSSVQYDNSTTLKKKNIESRYETTSPPPAASKMVTNQSSLSILPGINHHRSPSALEYQGAPEEYATEDSPAMKNPKNFFHARGGSTQEHTFSSIANN